MRGHYYIGVSEDMVSERPLWTKRGAIAAARRAHSRAASLLLWQQRDPRHLLTIVVRRDRGGKSTVIFELYGLPS